MALRRLFVDPLRYGPPLLCLSMVLRVGDGGLPLEVCLSVHIASSSLLAPGRGLTSTVFCFSVLDKQQMSMRIKLLVFIGRLLFGAWCQHLADSHIPVSKVVT
ncbi:hypothetical protein IGI04_013007 [Brassica rapa subsp. trilocularis]|uniref:Secreted protein n=1 Tax=Brassica rapa subsp. trilocularis TaxID=1813537 RepID=A0ABQ7N869_BRACM|nr:hypothetical protein IGI04_013007 [Brassica rapa subsp. trilocularis]